MAPTSTLPELEMQVDVLGIENRTENWKTARKFSRFFEASALPLAEHLAKPIDETVKFAQLELFWKGMRDFIKQQKCNGKSEKCLKEKIGKSYSKLFPRLRTEVEKFCKPGGFKPLCTNNYLANDIEKLYENLRNTEIDIVVETDRHLFIGEAKYRTGLHAKSEYVLVHQLVRQYVMAKILMDLCEKHKTVVPFVVGVDVNRKPKQVKFMLEQDWLNKDNILSWEDIDDIPKPRTILSS